MKRILTRKARGWTFLLCLASPLRSDAAQFIDLTVEIQCCDWDYMFFYDQNHADLSEPGTPSIFTEPNVRRCVIGANTWMIESPFPGFDETRWFTGTNIIAHTVVKNPPPQAVLEHSKLAVTVPPAGHRSTKIHDSIDGNPGRPGGIANLMGFDLPASISWLAFCSGPALRHDGRRIYPPSPMWKESAIFYSGWSDSTELFKDNLGLPRTLNLLSTNSQPIFQYRVRQSTNVLGWTIPLEFYGVQYLPTASNLWKLHLTFKGRVTSIGPGTEPEIPKEVMEVIGK